MTKEGSTPESTVIVPDCVTNPICDVLPRASAPSTPPLLQTVTIPTTDTIAMPKDEPYYWKYQLPIIWLVVVVIGAIIISSVRQIGLIRSLLPIFAMIFYCVYGRLITTKNASRFADSIYFMGFLWTLYALIDALIIRQGAEITDIRTAFGYALITTGAGMFLRLQVQTQPGGTKLALAGSGSQTTIRGVHP